MSASAELIARLADAISKARLEGDYRALMRLLPYPSYLGIESIASDAGVCFRLPFRPDLIGNSSLPALHGGVISAFMETAGLLSVITAEQQKRIPKPIDFSLDYLRSARAEDSFAQCKIVRHGRRVVMAQIQCWQSDVKRPVAIARTHFLIEAYQTEAEV